MPNTYSCTHPGCGKIFSRAFELKKHKVLHEEPHRVFRCRECDFYSLQRKNLAIHLAIHTGEKNRRCPDNIAIVDSSGLITSEGRCEYRTNDPAALTKHRKKIHGYIPPISRRRPGNGSPATPRGSCEKKGRTVPRRLNPPPSECPLQASSPEPPLIPEPGSGFGYMSSSTTLLEETTPFLWGGNVDAYGQSMTPPSCDVSAYDYSASSNRTLVAPEEEMDLNTLCDPSLDPEWMTKYEMSYSTFDLTGMSYTPQPFLAIPDAYTANLAMPTGREGCLCPEWMVDAGIEGWDQSVLDMHREFYVFDA